MVFAPKGAHATDETLQDFSNALRQELPQQLLLRHLRLAA